MSNAVFFLILGMILYIICLVAAYNIIFKRIKPGDHIYVYLDDEYYDLDTVIMTDKDNNIIRTGNHGDFTAMDLFKGNIAICKD